VEDALGENWTAVDMCLRHGYRGLPDGSSLARLPAAEHGVRNVQALPPLTEGVILGRAAAYHQRMGRWPTESSGPVAEGDGEVWANVNAAFRDGDRNLPGGDALVKLLARRIGPTLLDSRVIPTPEPRTFTAKLIRAWAREHKRSAGRWPGPKSGAVAGVPGETWKGIDLPLFKGLRGLPPGGSLVELLRGMGPGSAKPGPKPRGKA
jgi:hypothetical protein